MSRLSFRPRPLDIHKKLPIVKSVKDFEDEDSLTSTRNSQILRLAAEADNEVLLILLVCILIFLWVFQLLDSHWFTILWVWNKIKIQKLLLMIMLPNELICYVHCGVPLRFFIRSYLLE